MRRRRLFRAIGPAAFSLCIIAAIGFLSYKIYTASLEKYQVLKQISTFDRELEALDQKTKALQALIAKLHDKEYVEKEARKKLNLQKQGEKTVIITDAETRVSPDSQKERKKEEEPSWYSNLKKWLEALL